METWICSLLYKTEKDTLYPAKSKRTWNCWTLDNIGPEDSLCMQLSPGVSVESLTLHRSLPFLEGRADAIFSPALLSHPTQKLDQSPAHLDPNELYCPHCWKDENSAKPTVPKNELYFKWLLTVLISYFWFAGFNPINFGKSLNIFFPESNKHPSFKLGAIDSSLYLSDYYWLAKPRPRVCKSLKFITWLSEALLFSSVSLRGVWQQLCTSQTQVISLTG